MWWEKYRTPERGTFEAEPSGPRPAVAHRAGARVLDPQPGDRPSAVGMATGIVSTTPTVAHTGTGAVFVALRTGGVARSLDGGSTWKIIRPPDSGGDSHRGASTATSWRTGLPTASTTLPG